MRNRHYLLFDLLAMTIVPAIALILRLDNMMDWQPYLAPLAVYTGFSIVIKLVMYYKLGMYKHLWRYASIEEVSVILIAIFTAGFTFNIIYLLLLPLFPKIPHAIPRSVPAIDLMLSLVIHGGIRLLGRMYSTEQKKREPALDTTRSVLIIGAGNSGTMIAKELLRNPAGGLTPVGFIDDDPRKRGGVIYGIPVLGDREKIPEVCKRMKISQVLIAMPSASGKTIQSILRITEPLKIKTRTLPSVSELLNDTVELRQFRDLRIDDLLRRDPVKTDMSRVKEMLYGQRVLVTGAGGSIGSEICRLIAQSQPASLCLLGHGENSIHAIHRELTEKHPTLPLQTLIADIRDEERISAILNEHRPAYIYHAAAHKHVPLMEDNIVDALTNNVLGTITMLKCARAHQVRKFTLISTDKAVDPRSIMGVTKRMAEIALQLYRREYDAPYVAVRFGNVLGSRGSVVPIFMDQISAGGPVTITDPDMRRYFMTIPEAVQLVLQTSALQGSGEIYVLDMGEPVRVLDLALDLISLAGQKPFKDVDIVYTGLRPGEKLVEELFREGEIITRSKHEKIFSVVDPKFDSTGWGGLPIDGNGQGTRIATLDEYEEYLRSALSGIDHSDRAAFVRLITTIVPEYRDGIGGPDRMSPDEHVERLRVSS